MGDLTDRDWNELSAQFGLSLTQTYWKGQKLLKEK